MDYQEESIFNLIPKETYIPPKPKRHVSKYDPKMAPTASTFGLITTSKPNISNISGHVQPPSGSHQMTANGAMFGQPKGACKPHPNQFRLKGTGTMKLPECKCESSQR